MFVRRAICGLLFFVTVLMGFVISAHAENNFGVRGLAFRGQNLTTACDLAQNAGIGWYRGGLMWKDLVDLEGNFSWDTLDKQIKRALRRGIKIMLTLRSVHEVYAPDSALIDLDYKTVWKSAPPAPEYMENYKDFVESVVERYDGDGFLDAEFITEKKNVKHWQIENEPGKKPNRGSSFWKGSAADYAELYLVAHDVIKQADPEALVALAGFNYNSIKYALTNDNSFPLEVLTILAEQEGDFDIFDYHFYEDYTLFPKIHDMIHSVYLNRYGQFQAKPVWVTETNMDKNKLNPDYTIDEYNRFMARDIVKRFATCFHHGVEKVFWFKLSDEKDAVWNVPMEPNDYTQFRGLTDNQFTPKPVYHTYVLLIEKLKGKDRVVKKNLGPKLYVYKFGRAEDAVYVLWYDDPLGESLEASIPVDWGTVLITHVISELGESEPATEVATTLDGYLQIVLDNAPVFVELYLEE